MTESPRPSFAEAFRFWLKLGFISFGGPTGQIAIMHTELVERRRWIDDQRFLHALNFCMLLPGPEAQQLATYCGWLLHGLRGALAAGALFVLPSAILLWGLSALYVGYGHSPTLQQVFLGLKAAVVAIVVHALISLVRKALKAPWQWALAGSAFLAIYAFHVPFPLIVLGAAVAGLAISRPIGQADPISPGASASPPGPENSRTPESLRVRAERRGGWFRAAPILAVGLTLWFGPTLVAGWSLGWNHILPQAGLFFSQAAVVTFGGAYAVLPYVAQYAEAHDWLTPGQMLDGLGLAETTPGPLIMVVQFVGFLAGWNHSGGFSPLTAATLAAAITTWVTFVPCFLYILLGAPYVEGLRRNRWATAALAAITAAVVGVVLNLAVTFSSAVLIPRGWSDPQWGPLLLACVAFVALDRLRAGVATVVLASGFLGWLSGTLAG